MCVCLCFGMPSHDLGPQFTVLYMSSIRRVKIRMQSVFLRILVGGGGSFRSPLPKPVSSKKKIQKKVACYSVLPVLVLCHTNRKDYSCVVFFSFFIVRVGAPCSPSVHTVVVAFLA